MTADKRRLMPADTPDYMFPAWLGCMEFALGEASIRACFEKDTGLKWRPPENGLDAAIDKATGYGENYVARFIEWANVNVLGLYGRRGRIHVGHISGATRNLGAPSGWDREKDGICGGLPIRDEEIGRLHCMTSAWLPTPEELAALNAGAPVYLRVVGTGHPPVMVYVEERKQHNG